MAEMVPYEFWSYMNSAIKMKNPDAFLMAEVYNPNEYRNYIYLGKMDYLYDKVATYDKLKEVVQGRSSADGLTNIQNSMADIESHMLHFLDNHDEQRLASPEFAGSGECGKPLMVVSATIGSAPTMLYFGQEVGEAGNENGGFGTRSRTSIFDYVGVPSHQRWMNGGKFDGGLLSDKEKELRDFYKRLLNFTLNSDGLMEQFEEIQTINRKETANYDESKYAFVRWSAKEKLIIAVNFSKDKDADINLIIPAAIIAKWKLKDGIYKVTDQLYGGSNQLQVVKGIGTIKVNLSSSGSFIYKL
jgi:glycosidase